MTVDLSGDAHVRAHRFGALHQAEVLASDCCGCFYSLANFTPSAIEAWINERFAAGRTGKTALCPKREIDSVIGSAAGYPISPECLKQMRGHWFGA
jgi:hypothetical protein